MEQYYGYRRVVERVPCSLAGMYMKSDKSLEQLKCVDISKKGVGVSISTPLRIKSELSFDLNTANLNHIHLQGEVCWCHKTSNSWRAGIRLSREIPYELNRVV